MEEYESIIILFLSIVIFYQLFEIICKIFQLNEIESYENSDFNAFNVFEDDEEDESSIDWRFWIHLSIGIICCLISFFILYKILKWKKNRSIKSSSDGSTKGPSDTDKQSFSEKLKEKKKKMKDTIDGIKDKKNKMKDKMDSIVQDIKELKPKKN
mgnify:CR=1 FL=1|tara:strand:- start:225 stop:689 length:465 start_codon:yes stop_codon:yes gene_type:complete